MEKGFMCVFTLDRIEELRRFLASFSKHNDLPICIFLAKDQPRAHRIKTQMGFLAPFKYTAFLDIDMLVNANLNDLFSTAEQGKIGIVREKTISVLNSGMIVFPKELMTELCFPWNSIFEKKLLSRKLTNKGLWEQHHLNKIIPRFPHVELPFEYNCIVKDRTPEEELKIYDSVKIFHFLHAPDVDREKYKSYQEFMKL